MIFLYMEFILMPFQVFHDFQACGNPGGYKKNHTHSNQLSTKFQLLIKDKMVK